MAETARDREKDNGQEIDVVHDDVKANLYDERGEVCTDTKKMRQMVRQKRILL